MTDPTLVWLDCETTGLHPTRRAWDVAAIVRRPDQPDVEFQWFVDLLDLEPSHADPKALNIGRFWERHPQARWLLVKDGRCYLDPACPDPLPMDGVVRERDMLTAVAGLTTDRAVVCGSNPAFDVETLTPRMAWYDITPGWHYHPEDTPAVARGWLLGRGGQAPRKTDQIAMACGVDPGRYERHTALGDCRMMRDLYDRVDGRWVPGPPRICATGFCHSQPVTLVGGEPRCTPCADAIDPAAAVRQPLPDRVVVR